MAVAQQDSVWQAVTFSLSLCLIRRAAGGAAEAGTRLLDSESEPDTIIAQITLILDANLSVATIVRQGLELLRHLASLEEFQVSESFKLVGRARTANHQGRGLCLRAAWGRSLDAHVRRVHCA
jgi:hypothetical protein